MVEEFALRMCRCTRGCLDVLVVGSPGIWAPAQAALEAFDERWGARFPVITQAWLNAWEYVTPFLAFSPELRRVVYTTNAIEALNRQLRKAIKTKGHFPNEEAARKLIYLAITNAVPAWTRTRNWTTALLAFKTHFGDRLPE
jgi:putative transposase